VYTRNCFELSLNEYWHRPFGALHLSCRNTWQGATDEWCFDSWRRQKDFSQMSRPTVGLKQPPNQWVLGAVSSGTKRPDRQADYIPPPVPRLRMSGSILLLQVFAVVTRTATNSRLMGKDMICIVWQRKRSIGISWKSAISSGSIKGVGFSEWVLDQWS